MDVDFDGRIIFFDTELSSGGSSWIVEVAAVEMVGGKLTGEKFHAYARPPEKVHWYARKIHGLSNRFLADYPDISETLPGLLEFIGNSPVMAHGAKGDAKALRREITRAGMDENSMPKMFCTERLASRVAERSGLDALMSRYLPEIKPRGKHSALDDSFILAGVFQRIRQQHPEEFSSYAMDMARADAEKKTTPRKRSGPRNKGNGFITTPVSSEELTRIIEEVNRTGDVSLAVGLKMPRDAILNASPEEMMSRASADTVRMLEGLENQRYKFRALRMMERGMRPELAVEMYDRLYRLTHLIPDADQAPTP